MNGEGGIDGVISNAQILCVSHSWRLGLGAEGAHLWLWRPIFSAPAPFILAESGGVGLSNAPILCVSHSRRLGLGAEGAHL